MTTQDHDLEPDGTAPTPGDPVTSIVDEVAAELAERRARGDLPTFPPHELQRQFDAVIESVNGGLDEPPIDPVGLGDAAELRTWRPDRKPTAVRHLLGIAFRPISRVIGLVVRRQTGPFAQRTTELLVAVVDRQNRTAAFLGRAHLDRIRAMEYRIAELEREVDDLRRSPGGVD